MFRKLKCIGGPNDGNYIEVDKAYKVGDQIQWCKPVMFTLLIYEIQYQQITENDVYIYRISALYFVDETMEFLVISGWTDKEAIKYQFSK